MKMLKNGLFITLEGIDGSGKTMLTKNLHTALQQHDLPVIATKEPGGTQLGITLRALLQEQTIPINPKAEFLMFAADRAQHMHAIIKPNLAANKIVLSDRSADSSLVYQGYGRGLDTTLITTVNKWAMDNVQPDLTLYVKVDVQTALHRIALRNEKLTAFEKEKTAFFEKLVHGFDTVLGNRANVVILDGTQAPNAVCERALQVILDLIANKMN